MVLSLSRTAFISVLFSIAVSPVFAACHAVTPSGSGSANGTNWSNAYAGLPVASLVRGDTYYLSDGTYPTSYTISTAASGTSVITFQKAQSYNYGRSSDGCSNDISAGWNASTMGSSQAIFPQYITVNTSYLTFNGNGTSTAPGCGGAPGSTVASGPPNPSDCGISFNNYGGSNSLSLYNQSGNNLVYNYIEIEGNGNNATDQHEVFGGTSPTTYTHIYGHYAGCVYFQDGGDGRTISYSYFWGTEVNGATGGCHGQFSFEDGSTSNGSDHDNVYRDITGTAIWTFANSSTTHNNWTYYNNVIWFSSPAASWAPYLSDGLIACINSGTTCTNFVLSNNTIVNVPITSTSGINNENTGSYTVENNLWYIAAFGTTFNAGTGGTFTRNSNTFLNDAACPSGTANVCVGSFSSQSAPNPFVSWQTGNFNLAAENSDWTNALSLSAPYNTDPNGTARTTDRGAYQFITAGCSITSSSVGPYTKGQSVSLQFTPSNCSTGTFTISLGSLSGSGLTLSSGGLLSGTAQAGSFSFTVAYSTATDSISLTTNVAPSITTSSLPAGQVNVSYSQLLSTSGGTGAVTCAVTSGSLPPGLTLSSCTIGGTPTTANTYSFSMTPTDANGVAGSALAMSVLIGQPNTSTPLILHTTFCGPGVSWPGTCTLSAPTTAGSRLVVVYSSYNSAGSTPVMNSITDGGDAFSELANARSTNTSSATAWDDIWSASGVAAGVTTLTITPSSTQSGDVYVWEIQYATNFVGCASLSSQAAANPAVGASITAGTNAILLSHLHPAPGGNPTAVSSPFTSDLISDQMAYAQYITSSSGTYTPQWTQTAATFATATCAFSAPGIGPNPPTSLNKATQ
jgi:hypothetical protein